MNWNIRYGVAHVSGHQLLIRLKNRDPRPAHSARRLRCYLMHLQSKDHGGSLDPKTGQGRSQQVKLAITHDGEEIIAKKAVVGH
jgi:hypothetical protein